MSAIEFSVAKGSTPGGVRVRGRELVSTVSNGASAAFTVTTVSLTPSTFPRLSQYGGLFEEYFFHVADIMFQPSMGTQSSGAVSLWVDYDAGDPSETTQSQASRNISYAMANVYATCACKFMSSLSRVRRFATSSTGATSLQVNQALVRVATEGIPAPFNASVGYLFIHYDVEFFAPN